MMLPRNLHPLLLDCLADLAVGGQSPDVTAPLTCVQYTIKGSDGQSGPFAWWCRSRGWTWNIVPFRQGEPKGTRRLKSRLERRKVRLRGLDGCRREQRIDEGSLCQLRRRVKQT